VVANDNTVPVFTFYPRSGRLKFHDFAVIGVIGTEPFSISLAKKYIHNLIVK